MLNAHSVHSMRAMIGEDIPLNAGCLAPLNIKIPEGCLLSPSPVAAVCGGNVMTSQVSHGRWSAETH